MRDLSLQERKNVCLSILKYIDSVCKDNGIHYSLTGGTLLGAVRHGGFIPWDDDIDVFMARPEYERFNQVMLSQKRYLWLTREHDRNYIYNFGRVVDKRTKIIDKGLDEIAGYGVFVDVCVVDGLPDNSLKRKAHILKVRFIYTLRKLASYKHEEYIPKNIVKRIFKGIVSRFARFVGVSTWCGILEDIVKKYSFDGGVYVGNIMSQYGAKEILHKSSFDNYITMEFEGEPFEVIQGWEEYLTKVYGDYMKLPPEEKRIAHHLGRAVWINKEEDNE